MEFNAGEILDKRYSLLSLISESHLSVVWLARDNVSGSNVAIKIFNLNQSNASQIREKFNFYAELKNIYSIVQPIEFFEYQNSWCEVSPYYEGGSLDKKIGTSFSEREIAKLILDISTALEAIHSLGIIHLDIKPHNILIDQSQNYYLTDFSAASRLPQSRSSVQEGTIFYWAPEYFTGSNIEESVDVFSFGCVILEACNGYLPDDTKIGYLILEGQAKPNLDGALYSKRLETVIHRCLDLNPRNRLTALQLKNHAKHFLENNFWKEVEVFSPGYKVGSAPQMDKSKSIYDYDEIKQIYEKSEMRTSAISRPMLPEAKGAFTKITTAFKTWLAGPKNNNQEGQILYKVPEKMKVLANNRCLVRIAPLHLLKENLYKNLEESPYSKHESIKISGLMTCTLFEIGNPRIPNFRIVPLSTQEQEIDFDDYTEWLFDVYPLKIGSYALILKVTRKNLLGNYEKTEKDVLVLNREIQVENLIQATETEWATNDIISWDKVQKKEIELLMSFGETGRCLSIIANFLQSNNISNDLYNSVILLQSSWNSSRNNFEQNLIDYQEWDRIVARINHGVISLINAISKDLNQKNVNHKKITQIKHDIDKISMDVQAIP